MAVILLEPFDFYGTTIANVTSYLATVSSMVPFSLTSGRFSPSRALRIAPGSNATITYTFTAMQTGIVGFAVNMARIYLLTGKMDLLRISDGATRHLTLWTDNTGKLFLSRGTNAGTLLAASTNLLTENVWYHFEIKTKIDDSTGTAELRVNGDSTGWIPPQNNVDTRNSGNATFDRIAFFSTSGISGLSIDVDDLYVLDTSGTDNNDFLGDSNIQTDFPDANGTPADWTPNVEADIFNCLDNNPPVDSTFASSDTVAQQYIVTYPTVAGTVKALGHVVRRSKDDAGARSSKYLTKSNGTIYTGATVALGTTFLHNIHLMETDPDTSAAWTAAAAAAVGLGEETL